MIPFWPPPGLGQQRFLDYGIQCAEKSEGRKTSAEEVAKCMRALLRRDAMIAEIDAHEQITEKCGVYRGSI